ncbi:KR domain protein [Leptospira johnsonii]|uniref:KR domain protein n=2 Tax=Leptospira johnsonii TaxID=1917820 RepID=A0A2P2D6B4_9LEPT|nr:KR domain protein [Leptospira johnsonii]
MDLETNIRKASELHNYISRKIKDHKALYSKSGYERDLMVLDKMKRGFLSKDISSLTWLKDESKGIADTLGSHVEEPNFLNKIYDLLTILDQILVEIKKPNFQKTVLITGGSSGIGKELSILLYKQGYQVLVVSISKEELKLLHKECKEINPSGKLETLEADLTQTESISKILKWISKLNLEVGVLVNNAGFGLWGKSWELSSEKVDSMLLLNIGAVTRLSNEFSKRMIERKHGFILNVASTASLQPLSYMAAYAASKSYVVSFSEALAAELAPYGVKLGILYPGTTKTNFLSVAGIHKENKKGSLGNLAYSIAMDPKDVAKVAFNAIQNETKRSVPGFMNKAHYYSTKIFPSWIVKRIADRIFKKE